MQKSPRDLSPLIEEIRSKVPISTVVGDYVRLRKQGARWAGLCPFHAEKSPSFSVSDTRGLFYCFGCQKGGDVFKFLQEVAGIGFLDALRELAQKAGLDVSSLGSLASHHGGKSSAAVSEQEQAKEMAQKLNRFVAQYYHQKLMSPVGEPYLEYLTHRGLSPETIKNFFLGSTSADWSDLADFLKSKKAPLDLAQNLGLIRARPSGDGFYDLFRSRVMFPVANSKGHIIGFGGRIIAAAQVDPDSNSAPIPKYINSAESPLFQKSEELYGLFQAHKFIREEGRCLVVEGYMDVLALHQAGFCASVATLGTALTEQHVKKLLRLADKIIIIYDGDRAGQAAQRKAMETFLHEGHLVRGVRLPEGIDPDEYLALEGKSSFEDLIHRAPLLLDVALVDLKRQVGSKPQEKGQALDQVLEWLSWLPNDGDLLFRLDELSSFFQIDVQVMRQQLQMKRANKTKQGLSQPRRSFTEISVRNTKAKTFDNLDFKFLEHVLTEPHLMVQLLEPDVIREGFMSRGLSQFFEEFVQPALDSPQSTPVKYSKSYTDLEAVLSPACLTTWEQEGFSPADVKTEFFRALMGKTGGNTSSETVSFEGIVNKLRCRGVEKRRNKVRNRIKDLEATGASTDEIALLLNEFTNLQRRLDELLRNQGWN